MTNLINATTTPLLAMNVQHVAVSEWLIANVIASTMTAINSLHTSTFPSIFSFLNSTPWSSDKCLLSTSLSPNKTNNSFLFSPHPYKLLVSTPTTFFMSLSMQPVAKCSCTSADSRSRKKNCAKQTYDKHSPSTGGLLHLSLQWLSL